MIQMLAGLLPGMMNGGMNPMAMMGGMGGQQQDQQPDILQTQNAQMDALRRMRQPNSFGGI